MTERAGAILWSVPAGLVLSLAAFRQQSSQVYSVLNVENEMWSSLELSAVAVACMVKKHMILSHFIYVQSLRRLLY